MIKILFIVIISLMSILSCKHSKSKEESHKPLNETEKLERISAQIEERLSCQKEKIILLSEIRKISFDTLNLIIRDYYVITDTVSDSDKDSKFLYQNAIARISQSFKIQKAKIATLIFSYKYEMLTKEEIGESAVETFTDNLQDIPEPDNSY